MNNTNIGLTVQAWTDIVVQKWEDRILQLNVFETGDLLRSFVATVYKNAGGDPERILFAFNYYGKFVDMGVGKGKTISDISTSRKTKPWYSKIFYSECKKLASLLAEKYARKASLLIVETINSQN